MGCIDIFWKGTLRWFSRLTGRVTNEIENLFLMWLQHIGQDSWFRLFVAILLPDIPQLPTLQVFFKSSKVSWGSILDSTLVWSPLDWVIRVPALAWINLMCCWLGNFTLTIWPLTTQIYKIIMDIGKFDACIWARSHPERNRNIPSCFMLQKPEIRVSLMGHLSHMKT